MKNAKSAVLCSALFLSALAYSAIAQPASASAIPEQNSSIGIALFHCALFGFLGIVMVVLGFKIFDKIITRIDLEQEISKGNVAAAILSAAAIIGISLIVAAAIH